MAKAKTAKKSKAKKSAPKRKMSAARKAAPKKKMASKKKAAAKKKVAVEKSSRYCLGKCSCGSPCKYDSGHTGSHYCDFHAPKA